MKTKFLLLLGTALATTTLFAANPATDPSSPVLMDAPAPIISNSASPATDKAKASTVRKNPASPTAKKPAVRKAAELRTVPLVPGPAIVVANHVNIRTRAGLSGEVLTRLTNGEPVTVIDEIKLKRSGPEEPSAWAKIALPATAHAWVKSSYIDASTKTVVPKKLNIRGGPSENYGVLGQLAHGDAVTPLDTKDEWTKIPAPAGAYAFVAAQYLSQEIPAFTAIASSTEPPPLTPATVEETPTVALTTTETAASAATIISNEMAAAMNSTISLPPPPAEVPLPPRIVHREGIVRGNTSIQSPTKFELISSEDRRLINYLFTSSTNLDLNRYKGLHIIVTGEEGMDERWKYTPVITIQRIQVLE